jgi:serine/threonine-protein phosphatase 2A regulatory subunit B''
MRQNGLDTVAVEDVKDEIFDMITPEDPHKITLNDIKRSKVGGTLFSILTDVNAFWAYDNRESLMHHEGEDTLTNL